MNELKLNPIVVKNPAIKLSTGYEVDFEDDVKQGQMEKPVDHLVTAIIGEVIISREVEGMKAIMDAVIDEVFFMVQNNDRGLLDLILINFVNESVFKKLSDVQRAVGRDVAEKRQIISSN